MPFTSLSPKKGPEARSGPCTLYYPNELYEHKEFFFLILRLGRTTKQGLVASQ